MRGVEDQIHLGSRRKAPRLVQARRIRRKKRNGMHIPLSPHSIPKLKEAGSEPASGETRLGNISGLPLPRARTLRESGKMEQEGRFVSRTHLHSPLRCWGGRAGPRKMGTDGQVVGGCHPSPKSTATVTLSSRLAHLTDLRGRGPAAGSPPSVPRSPHLRTPSSQ